MDGWISKRLDGPMSAAYPKYAPLGNNGLKDSTRPSFNFLSPLINSVFNPTEGDNSFGLMVQVVFADNVQAEISLPPIFPNCITPSKSYCNSLDFPHILVPTECLTSSPC